MPTITHSLVTGSLAFILYLYLPRRKNNTVFTRDHVVLFTVNGFIGPDIGKITMVAGPRFEPVNSFIHNITGWTLVSIMLTPIYYLIFNGRKNPFRYPLREYRFPIVAVWKTIYSAGIMHFGLDVCDQGVPIFPTFPGLPKIVISLKTLDFGELLPYGPLAPYFPDFGLTELFIISMIFLVLIIYVFYKKDIKYTIAAAGTFVAVFVVLLLLLGSYIVHFENDLGFLLYSAVFWLGPLMLLISAYVPAPVEKKENDTD